LPVLSVVYAAAKRLTKTLILPEHKNITHVEQSDYKGSVSMENVSATFLAEGQENDKTCGEEGSDATTLIDNVTI
jgi:hypothetical protein